MTILLQPERLSLNLEPERRPSGDRPYDASTVERLEYIRQAKELGFTLAEVRELLELSFAASGCEQVWQQAETKTADIESTIRSLQQRKRSLADIVQRRREKNSTEDCPLLHKTKRRATR